MAFIKQASAVEPAAAKMPATKLFATKMAAIESLEPGWLRLASRSQDGIETAAAKMATTEPIATKIAVNKTTWAKMDAI